MTVLVAGIDSSTQSCKVVIREASGGALVREGRAAHPPGTEVDPAAWWQALTSALAGAGGLDGVAAVSVAGQQHGMVCLDEQGGVVRPALLWNDTRSAAAAAELVAELGEGDPARGAAGWAEAVGSVPVASFTVTKLRWLAEHEPAAMARTAAVCLPHDWLTWRLAGGGLDRVCTDRSDASGTGYWSAAAGAYRPDLLRRACGQDRKSTRLNSSHITISYAAFCLKKKKGQVVLLARGVEGEGQAQGGQGRQEVLVIELFFYVFDGPRDLHSFPTLRSSD